jgi:hypothetical protein
MAPPDGAASAARNSAGTLPFLDLLGEFVASLAPPPQAENPPGPGTDRADAQHGGDGAAPKGRKAERAAPADAEAADPAQAAVAAPTPWLAAPTANLATPAYVWSVPSVLGGETAPAEVEPVKTGDPDAAPVDPAHPPVSTGSTPPAGGTAGVPEQPRLVTNSGSEQVSWRGAAAVPAVAPAAVQPSSLAKDGKAKDKSLSSVETPAAAAQPSPVAKDGSAEQASRSAVETSSVPSAAAAQPSLVAKDGSAEERSGVPGAVRSLTVAVPRQEHDRDRAGSVSERAATAQPLSVKKDVSREAVEVPTAAPAQPFFLLAKDGKAEEISSSGAEAAAPATAPTELSAATKTGTTDLSREAAQIPDARPTAVSRPAGGPRRKEPAAGSHAGVPRDKQADGPTPAPGGAPPIAVAMPNAAPPTVETDSVPADPRYDHAADDAAAAVPAASARESGSAALAFAARLTPAAPAETAVQSPAPARTEAPVRPSNPDTEGEPVRPAPRVHKAEPDGAAEDDPSPGRQDGTANISARAAAAAAEFPARNEPRVASRPAEPAPARPPEMAHAEAPARPPASEPAARDIRLELSGTGQRVEVRLEERAGEVRLSVRTPDGALAETLRDHLPSLSERLEQSGFRADQWRAADVSGGTRSIEVGRPAGGNGSEERQNPSGGGGGQPREQSGRQRDPQAEGPSQRNQKGRDFAWLMSALR